MKVRDFDDFTSPNRKPWLFIILVAFVATFLIVYFMPHPSGDYVEEEDVTDEYETVAEQKTTGSSVDIKALYARARESEKRKDFVDARTAYMEVIERTGNAKLRADAERRVGRVNIELTITGRQMPEKEDYVVKRGNKISGIAKDFGTTVDLIVKSNGIKNPNLIKAGDQLRVFTGKFNIVVDKSQNDLVLHMNDRFFKRYRVGTGKHGRTPTGTFIINDKIPKPTWYRPDGKEIPYTGDPKGKNILGTRWMAVKATGDTPNVRGYGIHGTWDDDSIGKWESQGCIRLHNADVEEIFTLVPKGIEVTIVE